MGASISSKMSIQDPEKQNNDEKVSQTSLDQPEDKAEPSARNNQERQDRDESGVSAESSLAKNNITNEKLCGVCSEKASKYKCSRCYLPYCSIACSTVHKATHPAIAPLPTPKPEPLSAPHTNGNIPRPGTVAAAGFKGLFATLDDSEELQTLFKSYPRLVSQLEEINNATLPPTNEQDGDDGKSGQGQRRFGKHRPWNQDRGYENGVKALNRARTAYGKDGEGVREFCELVLQLVSQDNEVDAAEILEKELAAENARIVQQLLNGDL